MVKSVRFSNLRPRALGLAGILLAATSGASLADTITVTGYTTGATDSVANNIGTDNPVIATQIDVSTTTAGILNAYCTDLFDYIYPNTNYTFTRVVLAAGEKYVTGAKDSFGGTWTQNQVNLIDALLYNGNLTANNVNTAALQVAIWEVEYGVEQNNAFNVLANFGSGTVGVTDTTLSAAETYLTDATTGAWSDNIGTDVVEYLTNPGPDTQPLLYLANGTLPSLPEGSGTPVSAPEPASIGLFGAGLAALAYVARRRRTA